MKSLSWRRRRQVPLVLIVLGLTACAPFAPIDSITPTPQVTVSAAPTATPSSAPDVPITLLLQAAPLGDEPARPVYAIVTDPKSWDSLNGQIPAAALQAGREASVAGNLVIVAFAGVKGSSGYQVSVREAVLQADRLIVTVEVTTPGVDDITEPATTLPFALATIPADTLSAARSYVIVDNHGIELSRAQFVGP